MRLQVMPKHPLEDYTLIKRLGEGAQGTVTLAQHRKSSSLVAIKTISKTPRRSEMEDEDVEYDTAEEVADIRGRVINEYFAQCRVKSERHLAQIFGMAHDTLNYYFIIEYYPDGDLESCLDNHGPLSKNRVQILMASLVLALKALRKSGIVHCDIKPANILLGPNDRFVLSDYGATLCFPKAFSDEELKSGLFPADVLKRFENFAEEGDNFAGSPDFMAPEVWVDGCTFSYAADVWSAGMVGFYSLVGRFPWESHAQTTALSTTEMVEELGQYDVCLKERALCDADLVEAAYEILTIPVSFTDEERERYEIDEKTEDFFLWTLEKDQSDRATVQALETHAFFDSFDWKSLELPQSSNPSTCQKSQIIPSVGDDEDDEPLIEMGFPYGRHYPDTTPFLNCPPSGLARLSSPLAGTPTLVSRPDLSESPTSLAMQPHRSPYFPDHYL
ncbi:hypothetical protein NLI96_g2362 [Meripilus lineatus]|uniref:non-specific serine/threonine protein kinase n=1 Tax=Meripilus lineatus TaxID=2056292 RepID=A0AAD5V8W9_9APHY|nr:hypothetical protein NLI96_g2362 [Physisporinus lineatus]